MSHGFPWMPLGILAEMAFLAALLAALPSFSGWKTLAASYPLLGPFEGARFRFRSGAFGWVSYNHCLTLGAGAQGLAITAPGFLLGHAPVCVPWDQVSIEEGRSLWTKVVIFRFKECPTVTLKLLKKDVLKLKICREAEQALQTIR